MWIKVHFLMHLKLGIELEDIIMDQMIVIVKKIGRIFEIHMN